MPVKKEKFIYLIAFLFFGLFLYSGIIKFMSLESFRGELDGSEYLHHVAGILQWVIPTLELVTCCMVIIPRLRLPGLYLSVALMALFTGYLLLIRGSADPVSCSCGGFIERLRPNEHLILNVGFIALGLAAIWLKKILYVQSPLAQAGKTGEAEKLKKRVGNSFNH